MLLNRAEFSSRNVREVAQNIIRLSNHEDDLSCYCHSLQLVTLRKIIALYYLGRGGSGRTLQSVLSLDLPCYSGFSLAVEKLLEKGPSLRRHLERGLSKFARVSLNSTC